MTAPATSPVAARTTLPGRAIPLHSISNDSSAGAMDRTIAARGQPTCRAIQLEADPADAGELDCLAAARARQLGARRIGIGLEGELEAQRGVVAPVGQAGEVVAAIGRDRRLRMLGEETVLRRPEGDEPPRLGARVVTQSGVEGADPAAIVGEIEMLGHGCGDKDTGRSGEMPNRPVAAGERTAQTRPLSASHWAATSA